MRKAHAGRVTLDGQDLQKIKRKALSRRIALVEQHANTESNVKVRDVVKLGRIPHHPPLGGWTKADDEIVDNALARVGMEARARDDWQRLSGGERQRVHIARALAQAPPRCCWTSRPITSTSSTRSSCCA
ncbi:ATP-binding cassette domain-containing protein [Paracoccus cavernae]|uniref:ATP-binding cassette domain-containing protein n=1 Tax=Paracoccus cavernae TaxID=1571207 RepID=UPI00362E1868